MRFGKLAVLSSVLLLVASAVAAQRPAATLDDVVDRVIQREAQLVETLRGYTPLVETYLQNLKADDKLGQVPKSDQYFFGKVDLKQGLVWVGITKNQKVGVGEAMLAPFTAAGNAFSAEYAAEGFIRKLFVDTRGIGRETYRYEYVRREFLGEIRTLVLDVTPVKEGNGRFKGRIWVEDQDYTIVRFNGVRTPVKTLTGMKFHFDSWRMNVAPGIWAPAYIYTAETNVKDYLWSKHSFKAQTRLWAYNAKSASRTDELSTIRVEAPTPIVDQSETSPDRSPLEMERLWQREAERNVVERMEAIGLLAPRGEVDKVLDTVVNNLQVTNNLDIQPEVQSRVLLTSTLESFSFGHTIVISRGLLDVLPDEASLAAVLAHELAHVILDKPVDANTWGFNDQLMFSSEQVFRRLSFRSHSLEEEAAGKAVELLHNSPYKDKLSGAGLFFRQLELQAKTLPRLISPHLGNAVHRNPALISAAPALDPAKADQIAALPLGARIKLNPWTNEVSMLKAKPVPLLSAREKMPFEVTAFMPHLTRFKAEAAGAVAAQSPSPPPEPPPPPPQR